MPLSRQARKRIATADHPVNTNMVTGVSWDFNWPGNVIVPDDNKPEPAIIPGPWDTEPSLDDVLDKILGRKS